MQGSLRPVPHRCLTNARIATMAGPDCGLIDNSAVVLADDTIAWVGPAAALPAEARGIPTDDAAGRLITPGLIDCHTHVVAGGNRARKFEMRLNGASYEQIARAGGGIISSVTATRVASEEELFLSARPRVQALMAEGVTTLEIKSGYGLEQASECRMLRTARRLGAGLPVDIYTPHLDAHAIPPEYKDRADDYIAEVCIPTLHAAHTEGLVDAVDGFCGGIAFSPAQIEAVFKAAKALGLTDRGVIAAGQRADFAVWDVEQPAELSYRIGFNPLYRRIYGGRG